MFLEAKCKKCGIDINLDIGNMTKQEAIRMLSKDKSFECPGHHVEMSSPVNYWVFGKVTKGSAKSETEFLKDLKKMYKEVISTEQLRKDFTIEGFSMGVAFGYRNKNKQKVYLEFVTSPKGERYYVL